MAAGAGGVALGQEPRVVPPRAGVAGGPCLGEGLDWRAWPRETLATWAASPPAWSVGGQSARGPPADLPADPGGEERGVRARSSSGGRPTSPERAETSPWSSCAGPPPAPSGPADVARRRARRGVPRRACWPCATSPSPSSLHRCWAGSCAARSGAAPRRRATGSQPRTNRALAVHRSRRSSSSARRSSPPTHSTSYGYPGGGRVPASTSGPVRPTPPPRPPGLRRQLPGAALRPQASGVHRRPVRHVPDAVSRDYDELLERRDGVARHPRPSAVDVVLWDEGPPLACSSAPRLAGDLTDEDWVVLALGPRPLTTAEREGAGPRARSSSGC